jgi:hypothetical protein
MNPTVTLESTDGIPDGAAVRDYDELARPAKAEFPALVADGRGHVSDEVAAGLDDGEVVRYTRYYRVRVAE